MDSFSTREDSLEALAKHPDLDVGLPLDFLQNKEPKLLVDDLTPVEWPDDPALEWCPPGHGDLYTALVTSGMLEDAARARLRVRVRGQLRQPRRGARPAHPRLAARGADPVPDGGHRAHGGRPQGRPPRRAASDDGRLVLRETAQTPEEDLEALQDLSRHRYANTNNLWVDLRALDARDARARRRPRPADDPQREDRRPVRQVLPRRLPARDRDGRGDRGLRGRPRAETSRAPASRRSRRPTTCSRCARTPTADRRRARRARAPAQARPFVALDPDHYKLLRDFDARFPQGPPSLVDADRFEVEGDVTFGAGVVARGES